MNGFLTMTKMNLKLLLRNIGFLIWLVIIPIGAAMLLMVQQTGTVEGVKSSTIIDVNKNTSVMSASLSSVFDKISVVAIGASQDKTSELFLKTLSQDDFCAVYRYKTEPIERDKINSIAKKLLRKRNGDCCFISARRYGQELHKQYSRKGSA